MMRLTSVAAAAALALALAYPTADALACGGCFVPPTSSTVVTGHRMALSVSPEQTVLWDQIQYSGDPAEFAWVLPVARGAVIETSTAAWFEVLEATTQRDIVGPVLQCPLRGNGAGCGSFASAEGSGGSAGTGEPPVNVLHAGTVGPYETVTLATDVPGALNQWLVDHGFNVDPATQPIIDDYVVEGFDFIALRLQPGKGVQQMTPVRVVTQGAGLALPLRMVAIGTGAEVPIVLHVIGEGRYETQNFPAAELSTEDLVWDFETNTSNYTTVRNEALAAHAGRGWLTTYAAKNAFFLGDSPDDDFYAPQPSRTPFALYFSQAVKNGEASAGCNPAVPPPAKRVVDCGEAGCTDPTTTDASTLACGSATDVARAFAGLHPGDVWITRLEANLPQKALDVDLLLAAAKNQVPVERNVYVTEWENGGDACYGSSPPATWLSLRKLTAPTERSLFSSWMPLAVAAAALGLAGRRLAPRGAQAKKAA